jgi:hypothetical protein
MKRLIARLLLPSPKALAKWERTRERGLIRFVVVVGISWLALFLILMGVLEIVRPVGFILRLTNSFLSRPFETTSILLGSGIAFGALFFLANEALYRIFRGRVEP